MGKTFALAILVGRSDHNFERCIRSVLAQTTMPDRLILVYDTEYTNLRFKDYFPDANNIKVDEIFYKGKRKQPAMRNLALDRTSEDYIWYIDDDVRLDTNAGKKIQEFINISKLKDKRIASMAGRICEVGGVETQKNRKPVYLSIYRGGTGYYNWDYNEFKRSVLKWIQISPGREYPIVPFAQGTNMLFDVDALREIGGFNEKLGYGYSSYEDSETGIALLKKNYFTIYNPDVALEHYREPRIGKYKRTSDDLNFSYYLSRNYALTLKENEYPGKARKYLFLFVFMIVHPLRICKYCKLGNKKLRVAEIVKAYEIVFRGIAEGLNTTGGRRG